MGDLWGGGHVKAGTNQLKTYIDKPMATTENSRGINNTPIVEINGITEK